MDADVRAIALFLIEGFALKSLCATVAVTLMPMFGGTVAAEVYLHRDWGGVTTWVGNVRISARRDGRVLTSVQVGRHSFHDSNYGVSGLSYSFPAGRLDVLSDTRRHYSSARYLPYQTRYRLERDRRVPIRYRPSTIAPPIRSTYLHAYSGWTHGPIGSWVNGSR